MSHMKYLRTMINAEIIADSLGPQNTRLTTFVVTFPRIVLAEFNTHRMFSRNSASSRAIPFKRMMEMVKENPFIPIAWQKAHKGMQGTEYFDEQYSFHLEQDWLQASRYAILQATKLHENGATKQLTNRLLEPFMWHKVIITSSRDGLENFFKLRCPQYVVGYKLGSPEESDKKIFRSWKDLAFFFHSSNIGSNSIDDWYKTPTLERLKVNQSQAEIHIQALAECMWDAYNESEPKQLQAGQWHIPRFRV